MNGGVGFSSQRQPQKGDLRLFVAVAIPTAAK
jgi:hypothetical protein